ncbi:MAG: hypothetical protein RLY15_216 [Bacteroidota bacterium]|jgi:ABC-type multidrug transport system fused ATPase/permease subunit
MIKLINTFFNFGLLSNRKLLFKIIALSTLASFFEVIGLGIIYPIVKIIQEPEIIYKYFPLLLNYNFKNQSIVVVSFFIAFTFILIRTLIVVKAVKEQSYFIYNSKALLIENIIKRVLSSENINKDIQSNQIINLISRDCQEIVLKIFYPSIVLFSEILVTVGIVLSLYFVNPYFMIIISLFCFSILGSIYFGTQKKLGRLGSQRITADESKTQIVTDIVLTRTEIVLYSLRNFFFNRFKVENIKTSNAEGSELISIQTPRIIIELSAVFLLLIALLFVFLIGENIQNLLSIILLFSVTAFRLLPSINRILSSLQQIKYGGSTVEKIQNIFFDNDKYLNGYEIHDNNLVNSGILQIEDKFELKLESISFFYESSVPVIRNLNISIKQGTFLGITGGSGSGKSTLLKLILGFVQPTAGKIIMYSSSGVEIKNWRKQIGYVPQDVAIIYGTIAQNVAFGVATSDINLEKVSECLENAGLIELKELGLDKMLTSDGANISGGQRQRLGIARALYRDAAILLFDESTSALDPLTEDLFLKELVKLKGFKTILFVSHRERAIVDADYILNL